MSLAFVEVLLDTIPTPVFYKDTTGVYLGCNPAFEAFVGRKREDIIGKTVDDLWPAENAAVYRQADADLLAHPAKQVYEARVRGADGRDYDVIFSKAVFFMPDGTPGGIVGCYFDITEHKATLAELGQLNKTLDLRVAERTAELEEQVKQRELLQSMFQRQTELLQGALRASHRLLSEPDLNEAIRNALAELGGSTRADRICLYKNLPLDPAVGLTASLLYEWTGPGILPVIDSPNLANIAYDPIFTPLRLRLEQGLPVSFLMDKTNDAIRQFNPTAQAKSVLMLPVSLSGAWWGILQLSDCQQERAWDDQEVSLLNSFTGTLGAALELRRTESALRVSETRFKTFMDKIPLIAFIKDNQGHFLYANPLMERTLQLPADKIIGHTSAELFPNEDNDTVERYEQEVLRSGIVLEYEDVIPTPYGPRTHWITRFPIEVGDNTRLICGLSQDIHDRKQAEAERALAQEHLQSWVGELEERNRSIASLTEMSNYLQLCSSSQEAYTVIADYANRLFPGWNGMLLTVDDVTHELHSTSGWGEGEGMQFRGETGQCWALRRGKPYETTGNEKQAGYLCKSMGDLQPYQYLCLPVAMHSGMKAILRLWTYDAARSLSQGQRQMAGALSEQIGLALSNLTLREMLHQQAIRDHLTGLYNRRYLKEMLDHEVKRSLRSGRPLSVLMLDIDHFKVINDTFGHDAGDSVLRQMGALLLGASRESDIACRFGGEEFIVVLDQTPLDIAEQRALQIWQLIKKMALHYEGQSIGGLSVSIGVATLPDHGKTSEELLKAVDVAMYAAKRQGRDQVVCAQNESQQP